MNETAIYEYWQPEYHSRIDDGSTLLSDPPRTETLTVDPGKPRKPKSKVNPAHQFAEYLRGKSKAGVVTALREVLEIVEAE